MWAVLDMMSCCKEQCVSYGGLLLRAVCIIWWVVAENSVQYMVYCLRDKYVKYGELFQRTLC